MSKFTPGPWSSSVIPDGVVICSGAYDIAQIVDNDNVKQQDADAKLIAAAPEMYDELQYLIAALERYNNDPYQEELPDWRDAEKLLARIDGEEQED